MLDPTSIRNTEE
ncbi:hypothetical protein AYI69_g6598, partial [Smittium culicis]